MSKYYSEEEAKAAWAEERAWNDKQAWEASESARGECEARQQEAEARDRMTEYEEIQNKIFNLLVEAQNSMKPEHHPNILTHNILSIIAERCWLKDEGRLPQTINEPEEYLILDGWRPVKEIKKEE